MSFFSHKPEIERMKKYLSILVEEENISKKSKSPENDKKPKSPENKKKYSSLLYFLGGYPELCDDKLKGKTQEFYNSHNINIIQTAGTKKKIYKKKSKKSKKH